MLASALVVLAVAGWGAASPVGTCDPASFLPCAMPLIGYFMGPEGQQLANIKDDPTQITQTQLQSICRLSVSTVQCGQTALDQCLPRDVPDLREFISGLVSVMNVCDRPDLHSKFGMLYRCGLTLNTTGASRTRACANRSVKTQMAEIKSAGAGGPGATANRALAKWRSGEALKELCCNLKDYKTCRGTELAEKCGQETEQLVDRMQEVFMDTFQCHGPRGQNCPSLPPPTAEEERLDVDVTQMFQMPGFGGPGGPPSFD